MVRNKASDDAYGMIGKAKSDIVRAHSTISQQTPYQKMRNENKK